MTGSFRDLLSGRPYAGDDAFEAPVVLFPERATKPPVRPLEYPTVRLALTAIVFTAALVAAALVLTAPAKASWEQPQSIDSGSSPRVRLGR